jgi:hypothetical protein
MKIARIATFITYDDREVWDVDAVPNLMLIELLLDELHAATPATWMAVLAHEEKLRSLLAPLLATVTPSWRVTMGLLLRARRAPSPFVIR